MSVSKYAFFVQALVILSGAAASNAYEPLLEGFSEEHISQLILMHTGLTVEEYLEKLNDNNRSTVLTPTKNRTQLPDGLSEEHLSEVIYMQTGLTLEEYLEKIDPLMNSP